MAGGTDQSVNLSGMLSGIAETLGSGFQIGGVSAGQALGNNIREAAKPELDMKDPASIRKYAQWASRNGKDEEALLMQQKAAEVEEELTYNRDMGTVRTMEATGGGQGRAGEVELMGVTIDKLYKFAKDNAMTSPDAAGAAQQVANTLSTQMGAAKKTQFGNQAEHLLAVEKALKTGEWTSKDGTKTLSADEKAGLQAQRDMYRNTKPEVVAEANRRSVDRAATDLVAEEQRWTGEVSKKVFTAANTGAATIEQLIEADPSLKKYERQMRDEYDRVEANKLNSANVREAITDRGRVMDTTSYQERIDALPVEFQEQAQSSLDAFQKTLGEDGTRNQGDFKLSGLALTALDNVLGGIETKVNTQNYNLGQSDRVAAVQAASSLRVNLDEGTVPAAHYQLAQAEIAEMDKSSGRGLAYQKALDSDDEITQQNILYEIAKENMEDAALRLEIRAGKANYLKLMGKEIDLANEALKDVEATTEKRGKEAIMEVAEDMLRDNFSPSDVQAWSNLKEDEMDALMALIEADDQERLRMAATAPVSSSSVYSTDAGVRRQVSGRERVGQLADWYKSYQASQYEREAPLRERAAGGSAGLRDNASDITVSTGLPGNTPNYTTVFSAQ